MGDDKQSPSINVQAGNLSMWIIVISARQGLDGMKIVYASTILAKDKGHAAELAWQVASQSYPSNEYYDQTVEDIVRVSDYIIRGTQVYTDLESKYNRVRKFMSDTITETAQMYLSLHTE